MRGFKEVAVASSSAVLCDLTTPGRLLPEFRAPLEQLLTAADWNAAAEQGRIIPKEVSSRTTSARLESSD